MTGTAGAKSAENMKKGVTYLQQGQVQVRHSANVTQTLARLVVATDSPISTLARCTASVSSAPAIVNLVGCVGRGSVGGCVRDFSERIVKMKTVVFLSPGPSRKNGPKNIRYSTARSGGGTGADAYGAIVSVLLSVSI